MAAYWIARCTIRDWDALKPYIEMGRKLVTLYPHETMVRHMRVSELEDAPHYDRYYMHKFPSFEAAMEMYNSPEYQSVIPIRQAACDGTDIIILEEGDGYQHTLA